MLGDGMKCSCYLPPDIEHSLGLPSRAHLVADLKKEAKRQISSHTSARIGKQKEHYKFTLPHCNKQNEKVVRIEEGEEGAAMNKKRKLEYEFESVDVFPKKENGFGGDDGSELSVITNSLVPSIGKRWSALTKKEIQNVGQFLGRLFHSHCYLASWLDFFSGHLAGEGQTAEAAEAAEAHVLVLKNLYPSPGGALAWALETCGDYAVAFCKDNKSDSDVLCESPTSATLHDAALLYGESLQLLLEIFGRDDPDNVELTLKLNQTISSCLEKENCQSPPIVDG
eukprot:GHVT01049302.1.p1 GENE.GHVT01049302.1~~GHVT01049302.1.p1  ORF type:complete len:282 (+),score=54.16 GHVT01049302.1:987-1832(+)